MPHALILLCTVSFNLLKCYFSFDYYTYCCDISISYSCHKTHGRHIWVGGGFSHSTGFVQAKDEFWGFWLKSDSNFQAQSSFTSSLKRYKSKAHSLRSTLEIATPFTQWQITHLLSLSFLPSPWCTATITLFCQSQFPPAVKLLGGVMRAWGAE